MKNLLRVLTSSTALSVSWADLMAIDWNDTTNSLSLLLKSISVKTEKTNSEVNINSGQRLSLA